MRKPAKKKPTVSSRTRWSTFRENGTVWNSAAYRLTVVRVHARFDLRVDPQRRPFLHRAQQERLEVQEHLVVPFPVLGRLVRDDRREITVPASGPCWKQTKRNSYPPSGFRLARDNVLVTHPTAKLTDFFPYG